MIPVRCVSVCACTYVNQCKTKTTQGKSNTSLKQELNLTSVSLKSPFRSRYNPDSVFLHTSTFTKDICWTYFQLETNHRRRSHYSLLKESLGGDYLHGQAHEGFLTLFVYMTEGLIPLILKQSLSNLTNNFLFSPLATIREYYSLYII